MPFLSAVGMSLIAIGVDDLLTVAGIAGTPTKESAIYSIGIGFVGLILGHLLFPTTKEPR